MLIGRHVPHLPSALPLGPRQIGLVAIGAAAVLGLACYGLFRPRADANEIERRRRLFLAEYGRITDASLIDITLGGSDPSEFGLTANQAEISVPEAPGQAGLEGQAGQDGLEGQQAEQRHEERVPTILIYAYRVSGVSYECAQDVSRLTDHVRHVRIDLPVQVRYDPHNPSNSIVVAESWSGLRLDPHHL
jgi:hypothetical protein